MGSDDDEDLDEIEAELARVEEEIQELEEATAEPEAPEPEAAATDAPPPEEAFEGEPEVEPEPGVFSRMADKVRNLREEEEEPSSEEAEDEEETDEDSGFLSGLTGSDEEDEDDEPDEAADRQVGSDADESSTHPETDEEEAPEDEALVEEGEDQEAGDEEDDEGGFLASLTGSEDDDEDDEDEDDTRFLGGLTGSDDDDDDDDDDEDDDETSEDEEDDDGFLAGLTDRFGSEENEEGADRQVGSDADDASPRSDSDTDEALEAGSDDTSPEEEPEDEENRKRAAALLARFGDDDDDDDEAAPPPEEEEDDDGGFIVGAIVLLILLIAAAIGAYILLQDDSGSSLSPQLVADSFQNEDGAYVTATGQTVSFDAGGTQGPAEEYRWDFGDGETTTTANPTVDHSYASTGSYTVELTVVGADGEATTTLSVQVIQAPQPEAVFTLGGQPVAEPGTAGNNVLVGDEVTLDGSASTADPDHEITSYAWDVDGDGNPDANGAQAQTTFDEAGRWLVDLTVKDDLGNEENAAQALHVSDRVVHNDTIGPSGTEAATQSYEVDVVPGQLDAQPVQLELQLTYNTSSGDNGGLPVQPTVESDLDLNVTSPDGTVFTAEDDSGQGNESITVPEGDLSSLGTWNATVRQDNQEAAAGSTNEVQFELVVEVIY